MGSGPAWKKLSVPPYTSLWPCCSSSVHGEEQRRWMEVDNFLSCRRLCGILPGPFSDPEVPCGVTQAVCGGQAPVALKDSQDQRLRSQTRASSLERQRDGGFRRLNPLSHCWNRCRVSAVSRFQCNCGAFMQSFVSECKFCFATACR